MNLNNRQKAFFLFTLRLCGKKAGDLLQKMPADESAEMLARFHDLQKHDEATIRSVATSELRRLAKSKNLNYLSEVHNEWIVDMLKEESPEMIATILRYLPAERAKFIIDALPEHVLSQMPRLSDTYSVPAGMVEMLKHKFESYFVIEKNYTNIQDFEFEHFCLLSANQMSQVFFEMGYREIAIALKSIPKAARDKVSERLAPKDREHVEFYFNSEHSLSAQRVKRAQNHLLLKEIDANDSTLFVKELAFVIFAKAMLPKDLDDFEVIKRKLSSNEAKALQDIVNEHISNNSEGSVLAFREDILKAVKIVLGKEKEGRRQEAEGRR